MFLLLGAHTSPPHRCAQLFSLNIIKSELPIMLLSQYRSMPFFLNSKTFTNVSAAVCRQSVISGGSFNFKSETTASVSVLLTGC